MPTLGEQDLHFVGEGKHYSLYDRLGVHPKEFEGERGVSFAVLGPQCQKGECHRCFQQLGRTSFPYESDG